MLLIYFLLHFEILFIASFSLLFCFKILQIYKSIGNNIKSLVYSKFIFLKKQGIAYKSEVPLSFLSLQRQPI